MHPSPAERYTLERLTAAQPQRASAGQDHRRVAAAYGAAFWAANTQLTGVAGVGHYEMSLELGRLELEATVAPNHQVVDLPIDASDALGVIVSGSGRHDATFLQGNGCYLWWSVVTGFDDDELLPLQSPGDDGVRLIYRKGSALVRLYGPFTRRLAISFFASESNQMGTTKGIRAAWEDVMIKVGQQGVRGQNEDDMHNDESDDIEHLPQVLSP